MAMTPAGLKTYILNELTVAGVSVLDDKAIEAIAKAVVDYIKAEAEVNGVVAEVSGATATQTVAVGIT